jgi:hypothetical protein
MERLRVDRKTGQLVESESLRERFPVYLKVFALGAAAFAGVGLLIAGMSSMGLERAVGYAFISGGTLLLLVGGARGGGYSNMSVGAFEALVGGRNRSDDDYEEDADLRHGRTMKKRDPMARLRAGLRPGPNPAAFWQTIAGFVYIAMGLPLTF